MTALVLRGRVTGGRGDLARWMVRDAGAYGAGGEAGGVGGRFGVGLADGDEVVLSFGE